MNCPNCGTAIAQGDMFCTSCGTPVSPAPVTQEAAPAEPISTDPPVKKRSKKKKLLVITSIVAVVAILAGILSWAFIFSKETVYALVSERHYNANGINHKYYEYEYDKNGNLLIEKYDFGYEKQVIWNDIEGVYEYVLNDKEVDGTNLRTTKYEYDEKGYPISERHRDENGTTSRVEYEYRFDGELVTEVERTSSGGSGQTITTRYHLEYDGEDRLTKIKSEGADGSKKEYLELEYDSDGHLNSIMIHGVEERKIEYDYRNGSLTQVSISFRYSQGNWTENTSHRYDYDSDGRLTNAGGSEYRYDKKGNLISAETDDWDCEYQYDGRKITGGTYVLHDLEEDEELELEYDKDGNLIKATAEDGAYITYEYQKLRLSKKDAARFHAQQQEQALTGSTVGNDIYYGNFYEGLPVFFRYLVEIPIDPTYGTGPMHRGKS